MLRKLPTLIIALIASAPTVAQRSTNKPAADGIPPTITYTYVEAMPKFNGDIIADVFTRINSGMDCQREPGRCVATFTVEANGLLSELKMARSSGCPAVDSAVMQVLAPMSKTSRWTPGRQHGKPAAVKFALPVIICARD